MHVMARPRLGLRRSLRHIAVQRSTGCRYFKVRRYVCKLTREGGGPVGAVGASRLSYRKPAALGRERGRQKQQPPPSVPWVSAQVSNPSRGAVRSLTPDSVGGTRWRWRRRLGSCQPPSPPSSIDLGTVRPRLRFRAADEVLAHLRAGPRGRFRTGGSPTCRVVLRDSAVALAASGRGNFSHPYHVMGRGLPSSGV